MMERPVNGADGKRHTRLTEYMIDVVRRADAGDFESRMFLLRAIDRSDSRKLTAQRNAKKAKTEELRKFAEQKAAEISNPMPPLEPEVEDELAATVSPTAARGAPTATPVRGQPEAPSQNVRPAPSPRDVPPAAPPQNVPPVDASSYRRDPHTGKLMAPDGRVLTPEEEDRLANPYWPYISPHLKKAPFTGESAGNLAGRESPAPRNQVIDSAQDFGAQNFRKMN
jgi:hypothetical protein